MSRTFAILKSTFLDENLGIGIFLTPFQMIQGAANFEKQYFLAVLLKLHCAYKSPKSISNYTRADLLGLG